MEIQLQSILMPSEEICKVSELYYHEKNGQINFDGYFNLFYIEKRKAYTNIEKLFLALRLKGFSSLALYRNREKLQEFSLEAGKEKTYKIPLPYAEHKDGVFWFSLADGAVHDLDDEAMRREYVGKEAMEKAAVEKEAAKKETAKKETMGKEAAEKQIMGKEAAEKETMEKDAMGTGKKEWPGRKPEGKILFGMFIGEINERLVSPVNIGIDICTYRREPYVLRNLAQLRERILEREELNAASHIRVYVADNGKTLGSHRKIQEICAGSQGKIRIFPNKNAGGAGGFTRGMLEILADKEQYAMTHVLIMDDDAVVEPDALVRLYGVLSTLKPEWKEAAIGGTLMREDYPHILFCAGEVWENGKIKNPEKNLDVREFSTASCSYLTGLGNEHRWYSGWWCCCYPLATVREDNLPLPLFIHRDDIEYCLRNMDKGILFFNGIGVWHKGFELAFESSTLYYDIRNELVAIMLYGTGNVKKTALKFVTKALTVAAIRMRYQDADAVYRGFLDFLKGPKWLWRQEPAELNQKARGIASQYQPVEKVMEELPEKERAGLQRQLDSFWERFSEDLVLNGPRDGQKGTLFHYLTFNGWLFPGDGMGAKLITSLDSPWEAFRKKRVVWYEPGSGKALLARRDYRELMRMAGLYGKTWIAFHRYMGRACQAYQKSALTNANSLRWKEYLKER